MLMTVVGGTLGQHSHGSWSPRGCGQRPVMPGRLRERCGKVESGSQGLGQADRVEGGWWGGRR